MNILCTGSVAYDYLMSFPGYFKDHILADRLESISLSFLVDSMVRQRGGNAPNIAYNLALLGAHPIIMATVGEDFIEYRSWLESKGVDTRPVKVITGKYTASFFANTDLSNAQIASFYTGAMAHAGELSLRDLRDPVPDLVLISPNDPGAMKKYVEEAVQLKIPYLYDPSQQLVRMSPADIRTGVENAHALFVNEYEFQLLLKHTGMTRSQILDKVTFMVITCGEFGSQVFVKDRRFDIPVVPDLGRADPTGVGDAYRGGFLTGYRLNLDWSVCGRMGALAATYCLENRGTQNHFFTIPEFIERYHTTFGSEESLAILQAESARHS